MDEQEKLNLKALKDKVEDLRKDTNRWNKQWEKDIQKIAENVRTDPKKVERRKARMCLRCTYRGPTLSGQAFTHYICKACGDEDVHHNTSVPKLCDDCAKKLKLCKNCVGDI